MLTDIEQTEKKYNDGTGWTDCCFDKKKNDEHLRVLIGDEGRKRQHTRNDAYQNDRLSVSSYFEEKKKHISTSN